MSAELRGTRSCVAWGAKLKGILFLLRCRETHDLRVGAAARAAQGRLEEHLLPRLMVVAEPSPLGEQPTRALVTMKEAKIAAG